MGNKAGGEFADGAASAPGSHRVLTTMSSSETMISSPDSMERGRAAAAHSKLPLRPAISSPSSSDSIGETGAFFTTKVTVDDFELLNVVGRGSFGKVMQVKKKDTGKIYAMKVLKKKALVARRQVEHTKTERRVLEKINHPFIVSLRFAFQTEAKLYMVLDYFNGGELFFHLRNEHRFSEEKARFYASEIILAIQHLHSSNIVYRDLKPENILLDADGHVRLTDFGLSKESITADALTRTFCGTPEYLAPEVIRGEGYGKAVDWWTIGCLLYEMVVGQPPYQDDNTKVLYEKILSKEIKYPRFMSTACQDLISKLTQKDISKRLGAIKGAEEVMTHPFFFSVNWEKMLAKEVDPPFKPTVVDGDADVTNVDEEFKSEAVQDTPADSKLEAIKFSNFTYNELGRLAETGLPEISE